MEDLAKELNALKSELNKHVTFISEHFAQAATNHDALNAKIESVNADLAAAREEIAAVKVDQKAIRQLVDDHIASTADQPARKKARVEVDIPNSDPPLSANGDASANGNGKHEPEAMDTSGDAAAHVGATTTAKESKEPKAEKAEQPKQAANAESDITKGNPKGELRLEINGSRIIPESEDADDEPMKDVDQKEQEKQNETAKEASGTKDDKVKTVTLGNAPTIKMSEQPSGVVVDPVVNGGGDGAAAAAGASADKKDAVEKEAPAAATATPGKPRGRAPKDSQGVSMQWDSDVAVWRSATNKDEIKEPRRPSSTAAAPAPAPAATPIVEEEIIEEEMIDAPALPPNPTPSKPKGRAPHDRLGEPMEWDEEVKLWRSKTYPDETKEPRRPSSASGADAPAPAPAAAPVPKPAAAPAKAPAPVTTPVKPKGRAPHDSVGDPMEWDSDFSLWRSKNYPNETKAPRAPPAAAAAAAPVTPTARPRGRPPSDSNGYQMRWDDAAGVWRSSKDPNEIKQPNTPRAPKEKPAPALVVVEDDEEEEVQQVSSRPAGRAPKDSEGNSMNWNEDKKLWVSPSNPEETKTPGKRK